MADFQSVPPAKTAEYDRLIVKLLHYFGKSGSLNLMATSEF